MLNPVADVLSSRTLHRQDRTALATSACGAARTRLSMSSGPDLGGPWPHTRHHRHGSQPSTLHIPIRPWTRDRADRPVAAGVAGRGRPRRVPDDLVGPPAAPSSSCSARSPTRSIPWPSLIRAARAGDRGAFAGGRGVPSRRVSLATGARSEPVLDPQVLPRVAVRRAVLTASSATRRLRRVPLPGHARTAGPCPRPVRG